MEYKDYYKILGVSRDADETAIKSAYRKLARKYHPDVSKEKDAEEHFKAVQEAYEVLKDPKKRQAYNQLGQHWKSGQNFSPPPGWDGFQQGQGAGFSSAEFGAGDFSDFFEALFGGGGFRSAGARQRHAHGGFQFKQRGADLTSEIEISLEEAQRGGPHTISLQIPSIDQYGQQRVDTKTLNVKIPAGVMPDQQIRLAGQGGPGTGGGPNGDLFLKIKFKPHPNFSVEGHDVYVTLPITPWEAALGAVISAPTLTGMIELKIPAGSQSGRKLRLKGRGLHTKKQQGDAYVVLQIHTPPANTDRIKELYEELKTASDFHPR